MRSQNLQAVYYHLLCQVRIGHNFTFAWGTTVNQHFIIVGGSTQNRLFSAFPLLNTGMVNATTHQEDQLSMTTYGIRGDMWNGKAMTEYLKLGHSGRKERGKTKSYPFSANSMAGERQSSNVTLPDPNFSTVSTQAAAAPGTVTEFKSLAGISVPVKPRVSFAYSSVKAAGDLSSVGVHKYIFYAISIQTLDYLPDPFMAFTVCDFAS